MRAYAAALVLRAIAAARAGSLLPDGAVELQTAQALADGRWADALDTRFHPLFAALVAPFVRAGLPAEGTAVVLTVLVSALVAPLVAWTASRLAGDDDHAPGTLRVAALAGVIAAVQPWPVRLGGQVMAYGTAHAALALALALGVAAAARPAARRGLLVGGAIGLGWLARSDALATGAGLGAALLVGVARRSGPRAGLRLGAALALGAVVVMSPYLVAMRVHAGEWRLSLKKRVGEVVRVPDALVDSSAAPGAPAAQTAPELRALVLAELTGGDVAAALDGAHDTRPPLLDATWFAARKAASAANPLLLALAALGLALARWRRGGWLGPAALGTFVAAHALLKANWGYTSVLHQSAAGVLVAPLAGVGAGWLWTRADRLDRRLAPVVGILVLLGLTVKALEPQQGGKRVERQVGPFLRADAGPGPLRIAGHDARVVAHDAGADYLDLRDVPGPPEVAVARLRAQGARYLVVFLRRRDAPPDGGAPRLEAVLAPLGVVPIDPGPGRAFRGNGEGGVSYDWRLFRIGPDPRGPPPGGP